MYVYMSIYIYIHTYKYVDMCMNIFWHIYSYTYIYTGWVALRILKVYYITLHFSRNLQRLQTFQASFKTSLVSGMFARFMYAFASAHVSAKRLLLHMVQVHPGWSACFRSVCWAALAWDWPSQLHMLQVDFCYSTCFRMASGISHGLFRSALASHVSG